MDTKNIRSKIFDLEAIKKQVYIWKFFGKKIVFTNGCFDIIHLGHIDYLSNARALGNALIIGLNTDYSVKRIKGSSRPITDEHSRAMILASMQFVDAVVLFDDDTPYELIREIKPDILVKGNDYKNLDIVGADIVRQNGGTVTTLDYLEGYSTSNIIERIRIPE